MKRPSKDGFLTNMTKEPISIIIPVYNVENFIELSINSILKQLPANSEIVAIDDASTDGSLSRLHNIANGEPRLRVIALHENIGQGAVRNLGINESKYELILFVDSDDLLPDNAVTKILSQYSGEDVLVFNHQLLWQDDSLTENPKQTVFHQLNGSVLSNESISERKLLLENNNVPWNKLYKRRFLIDNKIVFSNGFYEDIPFNWKVLLSASKIKVINKNCYLYRQREGSTLLSKSDKHIDIISQYNEAYSFVTSDYVSTLDRIFLTHISIVLLKKANRLTDIALAGVIKGAKTIIRDKQILSRFNSLPLKVKLLFMFLMFVPSVVLQQLVRMKK